MKRLLLVRHAKSSWKDPGLADHERPLAPRGRRAARAMGRHLAERGPHPDRVLCSTAVRAVQTWERLGAELPGAGDPVFDSRVYGASARELLALVRAVPDAVECLMLVGHEPGIPDLALRLAPGDSRPHQRMARKFPTGACAEIGTELRRWSEIADGCGVLRHFTRPRDLD